MKHIATICLLAASMAGCMSFDTDAPADCWRDVTISGSGSAVPEPTAHSFAANPTTAYADMGFNGTNWPDLTGHMLTIIDHGAFDYAFAPAKAKFEALTGATVTHFAADDAGTALQLAERDLQSGGGTFDVIYGIDNVLMQRAMDAGLFEAYTPLLGDQVAPEYRFTPLIDGAWAATPVDMGYIGINIDPRAGLSVVSLDDVATHANQFVTEDPRFSSPGLGFLMATVAAFGEDCYLSYWDALFEGGVTITNGWTEAYVDRFSGGYGQWEEGSKLDKAIVTSYTTSPAYEVFYGGDPLNDVVTAPQSTFQQIQTMGILAGTQHRAAAEAWIEFTLTPDFQDLSAEYNAIYPVVRDDGSLAAVDAVYAGNDPTPGTFVPAALTSAQLGDGAEQWVQAWVDLYDSHRV